MSELLWKAYIDFEIAEGEIGRTRQLYERLLNRTKHLKVWISCAKFEASAMKEDDKKLCIEHARSVFGSAVDYYRRSAPELKEERAMLLEEWLNMERSFGEVGDACAKLLPKKLKKRRRIEMDDGRTRYEE